MTTQVPVAVIITVTRGIAGPGYDVMSYRKSGVKRQPRKARVAQSKDATKGIQLTLPFARETKETDRTRDVRGISVR